VQQHSPQQPQQQEQAAAPAAAGAQGLDRQRVINLAANVMERCCKDVGGAKVNLSKPQVRVWVCACEPSENAPGGKPQQVKTKQSVDLLSTCVQSSRVFDHQPRTKLFSWGASGAWAPCVFMHRGLLSCARTPCMASCMSSTVTPSHHAWSQVLYFREVSCLACCPRNLAFMFSSCNLCLCGVCRWW
jgi:hypothetical protein